MNLQHILDNKVGGEIRSVPPDASVGTAIETMCRHHVGALIVLSAEDRTVCGIVSERDLLRHLCPDDEAPEAKLSRAVREVMTCEVVMGAPDDTAHHALAVMSRHGVRHLPVVQGDRVLGMISVGDLLSELYQEDELKIRHLSDFLGGTYGLRVY